MKIEKKAQVLTVFITSLAYPLTLRAAILVVVSASTASPSVVCWGRFSLGADRAIVGLILSDLCLSSTFKGLSVRTDYMDAEVCSKIISIKDARKIFTGI